MDYFQIAVDKSKVDFVIRIFLLTNSLSLAILYKSKVDFVIRIFLLTNFLSLAILKVSVTPGERTSNGLSPLVSVGIRSLSVEPVPSPLMSVLPVGVR